MKASAVKYNTVPCSVDGLIGELDLSESVSSSFNFHDIIMKISSRVEGSLMNVYQKKNLK